MLKALNTDSEKNVKHWFVMRAYKNEKTAEEKLCGSGGLEYFIPKHYVLRTYHGVKTRRLVPVIPNLVFVNSTHVKITDFKKTQYNLLQFVTWEIEGERKYMIVSDKEMKDFIKATTQNEMKTDFYKPEEINLKYGDRIRIHGGILDGVEGVLARVNGKRNKSLVITLEGIMSVAVNVSPEFIEILDRNECQSQSEQ